MRGVTRYDAKTKIYFIATKDEQFVKIGISLSPKHRLQEFLSGHPSDDALKLLMEFPGSHQDELNLHFRFRHLQTRREWFQFSQEIRDFVNGPTEIKTRAKYRHLTLRERADIIREFELTQRVRPEIGP